MRKTLYILLFLFGIPSVYAQREGLKPKFKDKQNAIKINLLSPIRSTLNLSWHRVLTPLSGFQITTAYMDFDSYGEDNVLNGPNFSRIDATNQQTRGWMIMPEYRYMLSGRNLSGFYVGPFLRYTYCNYRYDEIIVSPWWSGLPNGYINDKNVSYHSGGIGFVVGKQYLFKNVCVVDFFCGPAYSILLSASDGATQINDIKIGSRLNESYLKGYSLRVGITFGIVR